MELQSSQPGPQDEAVRYGAGQITATIIDTSGAAIKLDPEMHSRWLYERWFAVVAGLCVGAVIGLVVYWTSRLTGVSLFVFCGTIAGGVTALVFYGYAHVVSLTQLRVTIPQFTDLTFAVTPGNESVAWHLFVECATRVSSQPLEEESGSVREALDSLYNLFGSVRSVLLDVTPTRRPAKTQTVEHLAISMLNVQLRPFLSKWHARLGVWEQQNPGAPETTWPENRRCRAELEEMRQGLVTYARGFGELAGVPSVGDMLFQPDQ